MLLRHQELFRADLGGCWGGTIREREEGIGHDKSIINDFIAAPDAIQILAAVLREWATSETATSITKATSVMTSNQGCRRERPFELQL
jgi:hypothetical protein